MRPYSQIQFKKMQDSFLHSLPLEEFKKTGIIMTSDIIEKHSTYLSEALTFAKENEEYILEDPDSDYHR